MPFPLPLSIARRPCLRGALRLSCLSGVVAGLAACAGGPDTMAPVDGGIYAPAPVAGPGPASDPWGPYIAEASRRFDVPEAWIRAVMKVESGGRTHMNGRPIVSRAGAMGLMQVMPATYQELRWRHGLGADPYDPRDNILAGTAYLRAMYDQFGSPGFLAAYNCGPGCLGEFLMGDRRSLPGETRRYVARIAPEIQGIEPQRRVAALAIAGLDDILRTDRPVQVAAAPIPPAAPAARIPMQIAQAVPLPPPMPAPTPAARWAGMAPVPAPIPAEALTGGTLRLPSARREVAGTGGWSIQVGAFRDARDSSRALEMAQSLAPELAGSARRHIMEVSTPAGQFYRARFVGFASSEHAVQACRALSSRGTDCMPVSPGA